MFPWDPWLSLCLSHQPCSFFSHPPFLYHFYSCLTLKGQTNKWKRDSSPKLPHTSSKLRAAFIYCENTDHRSTDARPAFYFVQSFVLSVKILDKFLLGLLVISLGVLKHFLKNLGLLFFLYSVLLHVPYLSSFLTVFRLYVCLFQQRGSFSNLQGWSEWTFSISNHLNITS